MVKSKKSRKGEKIMPKGKGYSFGKMKPKKKRKVIKGKKKK